MDLNNLLHISVQNVRDNQRKLLSKPQLSVSSIKHAGTHMYSFRLELQFHLITEHSKNTYIEMLGKNELDPLDTYIFTQL